MGKKILFVSTLNLSTNPRILKEIKLAQALAYDVSFLGFRLGNWSDELDSDLQKQHAGLSYTYLDASRKNVFQWLGYSLRERINRIGWKWNTSNIYLAATAVTKRTFALLRFSKKIKPGTFDLVIGHTLGAFYPASVIAGKAGCAYALDMEDFHPGEHIDEDQEGEIRRRQLIMKILLPQAKYVSVSSPLIGEMTKDLCGLDENKIIPVLNYFPANEFKPPVIVNSEKIKLIWFSQFIGPGRGLELVLSVWDSLKKDFELTLIGNSVQGLEGISREGIEVLPPVSQSALHEMLGRYDLGLALELSDRDINRNIALTNKLFAYYQSGLYIIATDTAAQKNFMDQHPAAGRLFLQNDTGSFLATMKHAAENIVSIRSASLQRYHEASGQNWETESGKLKRIWEQVLH